MRVFGWIVFGLVLIAAFITFTFGLQWIGVEWRGIIGPKKEAVERTIFEETPSFIYGMRQDLTKYRFEWLKAKDDATKIAIESTVRMRFARFNPKHLDGTPELYSFYRHCMGN